MSNECDNTGKAHLTNYQDDDKNENAAQCDCNRCDSTVPTKWTAAMNACCPKECQAWAQKASPTEAPAPTPAPVLKLPVSPVVPARPYVHAGKTLTKPYPDGIPYERTKMERRAAAKLRVYQEIHRVATARAEVARKNADEAAEKVKSKKKPDGYDERNAAVAPSPPFQFTQRSYYGDKHRLDTGPVNDIPKLQAPGAPSEFDEPKKDDKEDRKAKKVDQAKKKKSDAPPGTRYM